MFKKLIAFFHSHPKVKTTVVAVAGAALTAAGNGVFGPKGAVIAGAVGTIVALFTKRPQDGAGVQQ